MHRFIYFIGILSLLTPANFALAAKMSASQCELTSSELNKTLPSVIDQYTELKSTYCLTFGGQIEFRYMYELLGQLQVDRLPAEFKTKVKNSFCTGPDTSYFLASVDKVTYEYFYKNNGVFFDRFSFSENDC